MNDIWARDSSYGMQNEYVGDTMPFTVLATGQGHLTGEALQLSPQLDSHGQRGDRISGGRAHTGTQSSEGAARKELQGCQLPTPRPAPSLDTCAQERPALTQGRSLLMKAEQISGRTSLPLPPGCHPGVLGGTLRAAPDIPLCHGCLCSPLLPSW